MRVEGFHAPGGFLRTTLLAAFSVLPAASSTHIAMEPNRDDCGLGVESSRFGVAALVQDRGCRQIGAFVRAGGRQAS